MTRPEPGLAAAPATALTLAVVASLGCQAIMSAIAITPATLAPAAAPAFGLVPTDVGLFTTILYLAGIFATASGGSLVARLGAVRTSQVCLLLGAAGMATLVLAHPLAGIFGAVLVGLGYGPLTPASSHILASRTTARNRPLVFSVKQTSIPLGGALAGLVPPVIASLFGWTTAVAVMALAGVAAALALQPIRARFDADRNPAAPLRLSVIGPAREALAWPPLRRIMVMSAAFAAVQGTFTAFFVTFLVETAGIDLVAAGVILMLGQVMAVFGRVGWGALAERLMPTPKLLALIGLLMTASSLASLFVTPEWPTWTLFVLSALFGLSAVGWNGLYLSEIVRVTSAADSARATGGTLVFTFMGMLSMPAIFTLVVGVTDSYVPAFALLALVPLAAVWAMLGWKEGAIPGERAA